jgi:putative ABC transport system substrate-binding protein
MAMVGDPVAAGLVDSLARPGSNITGVTHVSAELDAKRLELLRALPGVSRVAVLRNMQNPSQLRQWTAIQRAAAALGVSLRSVEVRGPDHLRDALAEIARERVDAVFLLPDGMFAERKASIIAFAITNRLPSIHQARNWVEEGALMSYGADFRDHWRRAASHVDKILRSVKPADLPIEQPTKFELVVTLRTARALGLTIPPAVLARADQVVQ